MNDADLAWPNGARIAVATTVMFETWSDGAAPTYSVQTTHLKPGAVDHAGAAWSTYGGRVGVWRIIRTLDRLGVPATFFTNARCVELFPDAVAQIHRSGHDVGGHAYTQDGLLGYMTPRTSAPPSAGRSICWPAPAARRPAGSARCWRSRRRRSACWPRPG